MLSKFALGDFLVFFLSAWEETTYEEFTQELRLSANKYLRAPKWKANWPLAEGLHVTGTELCGVLSCWGGPLGSARLFVQLGKWALLASGVLAWQSHLHLLGQAHEDCLIIWKLESVTNWTHWALGSEYKYKHPVQLGQWLPYIFPGDFLPEEPIHFAFLKETWSCASLICSSGTVMSKEISCL